MKIIPFDEHTHKVGKGADEIQFFSDGTASIICLELSRSEILKLKDRGGKIWLRSITPIPPPVQLIIDNPFKPLQNESGKTISPSDYQQSNKGDNRTPEQ